MASEKLSSISEYDSTTTSLTGLSTYTGYTRSLSGDSLNTSVSVRSHFKNGLPGDRKTPTTDNAVLQQRLRDKTLSHKHNYEFCKKVRVTMALIGILLLVAAIFMLSFYLPKQYEGKEIKTQKLTKKRRTIFGKNMEMNNLLVTFSNNLSEPVLESEAGPNIALKCYFGELLTDAAKKNFTRAITNDSFTMTFQELDLDVTTLNITMHSFNNQCYEVYWIAKYHSKLQDCFDTQSAHWFGLGEVFSQKWPLDKAKFKMTQFTTSDFLDDYQPNVLGGVLEPFLVNSKGAGIYVYDDVPLYVSMNENDHQKFCIRADRTNYSVKYVNENSTNVLRYTVCIQENIKRVHKVMFEQFIDKPNGVPDKRMLTQPIWSTWVRYKKYINQSVILNFAEEIQKHNFEASHIEIDDQYSTEYGDFNFDPKKFFDPNYMLDRIRSYGFRTTIWVYPFANLRSQIFLRGLDFWMKVGGKGVPGITRWWDGMGGILDTTNKNARNWFKKRLHNFKKLKVDGFKFDAGEVNYLPLNYQFSETQPNPNYYSKYYVSLAAEFQGLSEVRVAYKSQQFPVFVRMIDRSSSWRTENGLKSVLTATLTFGILGYPFVLPDMVGGNAYLAKPNKELYVRWAQLCVFLPGIQFSITPWDFDDEVVDIVREALSIRKGLSDYIFNVANQTQTTGDPIVRPLWWYWPTDHETFVVDTEFMLGNEYLIAPVMHINILSHAIYLPAGIWEEQWGRRKTLNLTEGGFHHYNVTLRDICYFKWIELSS